MPQGNALIYYRVDEDPRASIGEQLKALDALRERSRSHADSRGLVVRDFVGEIADGRRIELFGLRQVFLRCELFTNIRWVIAPAREQLARSPVIARALERRLKRMGVAISYLDDG